MTGLRPQDVYPLLGLARKVPPAVYHTSFASPFGFREQLVPGIGPSIRRKSRETLKERGFILQSLFRPSGQTDGAGDAPTGGESVWSSYMRSNGYSSEEFSAKESLVRSSARGSASEEGP